MIKRRHPAGWLRGLLPLAVTTPSLHPSRFGTLGENIL